VQVDPTDLDLIARTAPGAEVLEVADMDHILRPEPAPFSNPRHYGKQAKKPIDAHVTEAILSWLTTSPSVHQVAEEPSGS
jgi:hypothetical protein